MFPYNIGPIFTFYERLEMRKWLWKTNFPKQSCFQWLPFPQWLCWRPVPAIRNRVQQIRRLRAARWPHQVELNHPRKIVVRPASLVLKSRSLLVQILNLQVHQVAKNLLHQVQAVVRLSHHLQIVHQFPQAASHRLLNLQTRINLQRVNPKRQRAQVIVKLQVVNLAAKLKLKRIRKWPLWTWMWAR